MKRKMFWGLIIVAIGVILLLQKIGIIVGDFWSYFWPVILIAVGLSLAFSNK